MRQHVLRAALLGCATVLSLAAWQPAAAQYCPGGYAYAYGYGCVPGGAGYGAYYGAPGYTGVPPVYEPFGFALGGLGGDRGFAHEGFPHGGFPGGFRGGGFHGNGFHGGGFRGGGGFHGGGHR